MRFGDELEAARSEWFIAGTEQPLFAIAPRSVGGASRQPRITAPADGTILALDPDIPPDRQRVRFEAEGRGVQWRIDGKPFGARQPARNGCPGPAGIVVQLIDARGQVADEIRIEVRGAGVVASAKR